MNAVVTMKKNCKFSSANLEKRLLFDIFGTGSQTTSAKLIDNKWFALFFLIRSTSIEECVAFSVIMC